MDHIKNLLVSAMSPTVVVPENENVNGFEDCGAMYSAFGRCITPGWQVNHIYREGVADNCGPAFRDFRACLASKLEKDESKNQEAFRQTHHYKQRKALQNDVLDMKKVPSWD